MPFLRRSDGILDAIDLLDFLVIGTEVHRKFGKHFHTIDLIAPVESHLLEVRRATVRRATLRCDEPLEKLFFFVSIN